MTKEDVLKQCRVEGLVVKLPEGQLERKLYQDVAKALQLIGGKWVGGKTFGFVFQTDPTELLAEIAGGEKRNLKKEFQFFATPSNLADELCVLANLQESDSILEPSAGQGAIIKSINKLVKSTPDCFELMEVNKIILKKSGLNFNLVGDNFLLYDGNKKYDKIIANPPFSNNQDIEHLQKMYKLLKAGGKVVCITSESWVSGNQKKQVEFKSWLDKQDVVVVNIPRKTFSESGTMVGGVIVIINKPSNIDLKNCETYIKKLKELIQ
jgi:phospholipid N-methyltransferase